MHGPVETVTTRKTKAPVEAVATHRVHLASARHVVVLERKTVRLAMIKRKAVHLVVIKTKKALIATTLNQLFHA